MDKDLQAGLYDVGVTSVAMLAAIAVGRPWVRRGRQAKGCYSAGSWQSAGKRVSIQDELDAEATVQKVPKSVPPVDLLLYRKEFEKAFYKLKDGKTEL